MTKVHTKTRTRINPDYIYRLQTLGAFHFIMLTPSPRLSSIPPPPVCPASSGAPQPRRSQTAASAEGEVKQEVGGQNRKSSTVEGGSPLLGSANNPNMADIPERRKTSATPAVSTHDKQVNTGVTQYSNP